MILSRTVDSVFGGRLQNHHFQPGKLHVVVVVVVVVVVASAVLKMHDSQATAFGSRCFSTNM